LADSLQNLSLSPFKKDTWALLVGDIFLSNGLPEKFKGALEKLRADIKVDVKSTTAASVTRSTPQQASSSIRASAQALWDMEYNNPHSLTRQVCKHCTRPRGLCDCSVADYQEEYILP
jgi:hypothetical protein